MFIGVIYSGQNLFSLSKVTVGPYKSLFLFTKIQVANRESKLSLPKIPFQAKRWQIWKASYLRGRSLMVRSLDCQSIFSANSPRPSIGRAIFCAANNRTNSNVSCVRIAWTISVDIRMLSGSKHLWPQVFHMTLVVLFPLSVQFRLTASRHAKL